MQQYSQSENPFSVGDDSVEMQDHKYAFFDEVDNIKKLLLQYEDSIERVEGLQRRSLAETRNDEREFIQRQIDSVMENSRGLAGELRSRIKTLESQSFRDTTKNVQANNLKDQFKSLIQKFQTTEAAFRKRTRDVAARQYRVVDPSATDEQVEQAIDDESGQQVFSQALMQSNRRGEARAALSEVQSRHREIQKIEQTMMELAQLFHDMEIMVAEQDEQVQNVETNVYNAETDVQRGVDNQYSAIRKARSARRMKWCCVGFIIFVIVVLALVLGIYFGTHH